MALDVNQLTIDYKSLSKLRAGQRSEIQQNPMLMEWLQNRLTPTQMALLFPSYYKQELPDVSGFKSLKPEGESWEDRAKRVGSGGATATPEVTPGLPTGGKPTGQGTSASPMTAQPSTPEEILLQKIRKSQPVAVKQQSQYTAGQLKAIAKKAGATDQEAIYMASIALGESSGNPMAHNPRGRDNSYGLWQINMLGKMGPDRRRRWELASNDDLFDPVVNARAALDLMRDREKRGQNKYADWSVYTTGKYRDYFETARTAEDDESIIVSNEAQAKTATPLDGGAVPSEHGRNKFRIKGWDSLNSTIKDKVQKEIEDQIKSNPTANIVFNSETGEIETTIGEEEFRKSIGENTPPWAKMFFDPNESIETVSTVQAESTVPDASAIIPKELEELIGNNEFLQQNKEDLIRKWQENPQETAKAIAEFKEGKKQQLANQTQEGVKAAEGFQFVDQGGGIRNMNIPEHVKEKMIYAQERSGIPKVVSVSSGQMSWKEAQAMGAVKGADKKWRLPNGTVVGTGAKHRHGVDVGAGDLQFYDENNKLIPFTDPRVQNYMKYSRAAGLTGIGAGKNYMGEYTVHVGGGTEAAWGGYKEQILAQMEAGRSMGSNDFNAWKEAKQAKEEPVQTTKAPTSLDNVDAVPSEHGGNKTVDGQDVPKEYQAQPVAQAPVVGPTATQSPTLWDDVKDKSLAGAGFGATAGSVIGSVAGPGMIAGTAAGAVVGGAVGAVQGVYEHYFGSDNTAAEKPYAYGTSDEGIKTGGQYGPMRIGNGIVGETGQVETVHIESRSNPEKYAEKLRARNETPDMGNPMENKDNKPTGAQMQPKRQIDPAPHQDNRIPYGGPDQVNKWTKYLNATARQAHARHRMSESTGSGQFGYQGDVTRT